MKAKYYIIHCLVNNSGACYGQEIIDRVNSLEKALKYHPGCHKDYLNTYGGYFICPTPDHNDRTYSWNDIDNNWEDCRDEFINRISEVAHNLDKFEEWYKSTIYGMKGYKEEKRRNKLTRLRE